MQSLHFGEKKSKKMLLFKKIPLIYGMTLVCMYVCMYECVYRLRKLP